MNLETYKIQAPAIWASYLINGDSSGIVELERNVADRWIFEVIGRDEILTIDDDESMFIGQFHGEKRLLINYTIGVKGDE